MENVQHCDAITITRVKDYEQVSTIWFSAEGTTTKDKIYDTIEHHIDDLMNFEFDPSTREGSFLTMDFYPKVGQKYLVGTGIVVKSPEEQREEELIPLIERMSLEEFYDQLQHHDWYSSFSDDHSVYMAGSRNYGRLQNIAELSGADHQALFEAVKRHHHTGIPWGNAQWDLPVRPENGVLVLPAPPIDEPNLPVHALEETESAHDSLFAAFVPQPVQDSGTASACPTQQTSESILSEPSALCQESLEFYDGQFKAVFLNVDTFYYGIAIGLGLGMAMRSVQPWNMGGFLTGVAIVVFVAALRAARLRRQRRKTRV